MRMPNENDYISVTKKEYVYNGKKLDAFNPYEVYIKEKTDEYIVIESEAGIVEEVNGAISLYNPPTSIKINKGETKVLAIPVTDNPYNVTIKY